MLGLISAVLPYISLAGVLVEKDPPFHKKVALNLARNIMLHRLSLGWVLGNLSEISEISLNVGLKTIL